VIADGPDPSSWAGKAAIAEGWRDFLSAWKDYRGEAQEYHEIDSERVYVLLHVSGRGKTSGLEIRQTAANLFTLRSGKVTRLVIYWDSVNAAPTSASHRRATRPN
jgi:ketosteroid isomerase-like protein